MLEIEVKIRDEFLTLQNDLEKWGDFVDNELKRSLKQKFIDTNLIKILPNHRIKDTKSYIEKALYRQKHYVNPIIDIKDKVGTRIVLLKSDDIEKVTKVINENPNWNSEITKNLQDEIDGKPNIFDYQSMHIVVSPRNTTEFPKELFESLTCEIQIRTLLQHAFAEISHDSTYKGPYKNDKGILRKLAKSMALMEATDDYFCSVFEMMADEERFYYNYTNELISLYNKFDPSFERKALDYSLTDSIFSLLLLKDIKISDIEAFLLKNEENLENILKENNGYLFTQPIILLITYFFKKHKTFLRENWPLNQKSLKTIYHAFNESFERY